MPRLPTAIEIRINNITASLTPALLLLTELNDAFGPLFVQSIANTIQGLINMVQVCFASLLSAAAHIFLWSPFTKLCMDPPRPHKETVGCLYPSMLDNIGTFMGTLHKIYAYIETQQEGNKIKNLFRSSEIKQLLQDCHAGLNQAIEVFNVRVTFIHPHTISERSSASTLLALGCFCNLNTDPGVFNGSNNSSNSFSMLPAKPKIFHGREHELETVLNLLSEKSPRIAILGGGGMGKTTLARAALHHPDITCKFEHRFFVSAEAATTSIELAALVGLHLALNPGQDLTKAIVQYFARAPASLLILDNLETVWEPTHTRGGVEKLLCLLCEIEQLGLMTFMEITDGAYTVDEVDQLLRFTDNMPLAVDLIAHLTDYGGLPNVLSHWELEKTSMLSVGIDRRSSLDASISLSLSSPRITAGSKELLSLLSILPNGLSNVELVEAHLGIPNIHSCKAVLLATSLAYQDRNKWLVLLMPIREYIEKFLPPSQSSIQLIRSYFYALLNLYKKYGGPQLQPVVTQITLNLANLHEVLKQGLYPKAPTLGDTIHCVLSLNSFRRVTNCVIMKIWFFLESLYKEDVSLEALAEMKGHLDHTNDPVLQAKFYGAVGAYFFFHKGDSQGATKFFQHALELSEQSGDIKQQCSALLHLGRLKNYGEFYTVAHDHASVAQRLAHLSGNLCQEAWAIFEGAKCTTYLGEYQESAAQLQRARELLRICGMPGGSVDQSTAASQAEIHLLKSEYAQCRSIHSNLVENTSPQENSFSHATALLNIAQIDVIIGVASQEVYHNLRHGREIFKNESFTRQTLSRCDAVEASIELRDGKFNTAKVKFEKCLCLSPGMDNELQGLFRPLGQPKVLAC
ncbi:hypothetical protein K438DRAFT_1783904 [Mycena galopus ATCC 62051]|nr:hypothetical protein K438DRAFT_1783904 [Mycena galopus ATCC 62051]